MVVVTEKRGTDGRTDGGRSIIGFKAERVGGRGGTVESISESIWEDHLRHTERESTTCTCGYLHFKATQNNSSPAVSSMPGTEFLPYNLSVGLTKESSRFRCKIFLLGSSELSCAQGNSILL